MTQENTITIEGEEWIYADEQIFPKGTDPEVTGITCESFEDGAKALKFFGYLDKEKDE